MMLKKKIRFGLYTIKNLGGDIGGAIVEERKNGEYKSLVNFLDRVRHKNVNKKSMESLVKSGAMDKFGTRGKLLANMETILSYNKELSAVNKDQISLFGTLPDGDETTKLSLIEAPDATKEEKLAWEKELLGLYVSGHPLDRIRDKLEARDMNIKKIKEEWPNGMTVTIAGIVEEVRVISTKKNDQMAFLKIADLTGSIEAVIFPKLFLSAKEYLLTDKCIAIKAKINLRNGEKTLVIEEIKEI